jgi:YD repeat-containing protein
MRTVVERPDGSYLTQYFDEVGQPLHKVITAGDPASSPGNTWITKVTRNSDAQITTVRSPANVDEDNYGHTIGLSWAIPVQTTAGLVDHFGRTTSSDYFDGLLASTSYSKGNQTPTTTGSQTYLGDGQGDPPSLTVGDLTLVRPLVDMNTLGSVAGPYGGGNASTNIEYDFYGEQGEPDAPLLIESMTITHPVSSTGDNGPGSDNRPESAVYYDLKGNVTFEKSPDGTITYGEYNDGGDGLLSKLIEDADTTQNGSGEDFENITIPAGFSSAGGDHFHMVTTYTYDDQGRSATVTLPGGRVIKTYYSKLDDERRVTLAYNHYNSTSGRYYGPVDYTVSNHAGRPDVEATVGLWSGSAYVEYTTLAITNHVDEDDDDPVTAINGVGATDFGKVTRMVVNAYSETGSRQAASRVYHLIPAAGAGSVGTNYDHTSFGYDELGRLWRVIVIRSSTRGARPGPTMTSRGASRSRHTITTMRRRS